MAANKSDIMDINLNGSGLSRSFSNRTIGEGDVNGDLFGVRVYKDGAEASLSGVSCVAYFIKADGTSVTIEGTVSGNVAYVVLPQSCYTVEGQFQLSIKLSWIGGSMTARIIDGTVVNTVLGSIIDPGNVIPDLADWTALVESAEGYAEEIGKLHIESELIEGTRYKIKVYKDE